MRSIPGELSALELNLMPLSKKSAGRRVFAILGLALAFSICQRASFAECGGPPGAPPGLPQAAKAAAAALSELEAGRPQDLIILFDAGQIENEAAGRRRKAGLKHDDEVILRFKAARFRQLKESVTAGLAPGAEILQDYSHLPMSFMRFRSRAALDQVLSRAETVATYENKAIFPHLTYSLPFINQPAPANSGITGSGSNVAVIDTGIDYTLPAFGSCTAPGVPSGCRVAASVDVTGNNLTLNRTANNHGTNVAGIVAGVAPGARIASINAFAGGASTVNWILAGIDWAIDNKSAYDISAINMSLGDGGNYSAPCGNSHTNPFLAALSGARTAGIVPVASSGNSAFTNGMSSPACTPGVVSVGAVYDANWGGPYSWGGSPPTCSDATSSAPDRIPCFSNSASYLTMLAPGAFITAAGIQMAGTSQAAPHVAAALALLRSAHPSDTLDQTVARMTETGVRVSDLRNGVITPRLNLLAALGAPDNDSFANRTVLAGQSGSLTANNLNATKEPGEPAHAGQQGGRSVWWIWTPTVSGTASIDSAGSGFSTLLSVYTGSGLGSLEQVAGSGGAGSAATFTAQEGTDYHIAVDGVDGAFGTIALHRQFALQADLVLAIPSPQSAPAGSEVAYMASVANNGPSLAPDVALTAVLPPGVQFVSASPGCSIAAGTVTCDLGDLAPGATGAVQIVVSPSAAGELDLVASVASAIADPDAGNNGVTAACTVTAAPEQAVPALSPWALAVVIPLLCGLLRRANRSAGAAVT